MRDEPRAAAGREPMTDGEPLVRATVEEGIWAIPPAVTRCERPFGRDAAG